MLLCYSNTHTHSNTFHTTAHLLQIHSMKTLQRWFAAIFIFHEAKYLMLLLMFLLLLLLFCAKLAKISPRFHQQVYKLDSNQNKPITLHSRCCFLHPTCLDKIIAFSTCLSNCDTSKRFQICCLFLFFF